MTSEGTDSCVYQGDTRPGKIDVRREFAQVIRNADEEQAGQR